MCDHPALQGMFDALLPKGLQWYGKGDYVKELSDAAIEAHVEHGARLPEGLPLMHLYQIDGAVQEVASDATARQLQETWSMVIAGIHPRACEGAGQARAGPGLVTQAALRPVESGRRARGGSMTRGSCLCGGVRFEIDGAPLWSHYCHCSRCRKISGSAFTAPLFVPAAALRFTAGEELVTRYAHPGTRYASHFCRICGSKLPAVHGSGGEPFRAVPLGALDDDPRCPPRGHIYVGSKAPWFTIGDGLPEFEEMPPAEVQADLLRQVLGRDG